MDLHQLDTWGCTTKQHPFSGDVQPAKNIGAESPARNARLGDVRQGGGRISPLKIKVQLRYADHKFVEEQVDWLLGHDEGHVAVFLNVVGAPKTLGFPVQHHHYWKIWGISTVWETHMLHPNARDINSKLLLRSTACRTLEAWKKRWYGMTKTTWVRFKTIKHHKNGVLNTRHIHRHP